MRGQIWEPIDLQCLVEVAGFVALHDAARDVLLDPVDAAAALHGRPEEPRKAIGAGRSLGRDEATELFREMEQNGAGLEDAHRLVAGVVDQRWDLGIRVDIDEPRSELIALSDLDQPGIVLSARKA